MRPLDGMRVAILAADGFEEIELSAPRRALHEAGAETRIVSPGSSPIKGFHEFTPAGTLAVDEAAAEAEVAGYDALLLPGGTINADKPRADGASVRAVRAFFDAGKPVAAICHAPWVLIEAGAARGCRLASYRSIRSDLENAGAGWVDEPVVVDRGLVTSRDPDDIPAFAPAMVEAFGQVHATARSR
jgi:deglycase